MLKKHVLLLALLEEFGGELSNTEMQKYLFLLTRLEDKKSYHFIPYKYGCFSFNAYSDKRKLIEKNFLDDSRDWNLAKGHHNFSFMLPPESRLLIKQIRKTFGHLHGKELIRHVYLNYPYYAVNSEILDEVLDEPEVSRIRNHIPQNHDSAIYTIGYEGRSIEEYINCLIKEDVRVLCDVRKNPISRKYGFSKKTLENALESIGIKYKHLPELGIPGKKRMDLHTLEDYNRLFDLYETEVLNNCHSFLERIHQLVLENGRVGLTCFERLPAYCHRARVAMAITRLFNQDLPIIAL